MSTIPTETCIYKSVTLAAGERFVLPSGSELLYVSDIESISSDCADIPTTTSTCYYFNLPVEGNDYIDADVNNNVSAILLDEIRIEIDPNYNGGSGTNINAGPFESGSDFVERLATNIWDQLASVSNGVLVNGLRVEVTTAGDDLVFLTISVPDIFITVKAEVTDMDSTNGTFGNPKYYINGVKNEECGALDAAYISYRGSLD